MIGMQKPGPPVYDSIYSAVNNDGRTNGESDLALDSAVKSGRVFNQQCGRLTTRTVFTWGGRKRRHNTSSVGVRVIRVAVKHLNKVANHK